MMTTLAILVVASVLFISGKPRADLVAVGVCIALMLTGILQPAEALAGFSNSVVVMMIGLFVVGEGIFRTGLANIASRRLLALAGTSETRLLLMVMLATAAIGAFVSNTGTVAVMMPIVVSLAHSASTSPGRLLMPLAFASSLGGMLTLIGTPPNLVIQETLTAAGYGSLGFFAYARTGVICLAVGLLAMLVLRRLLPQNEGADAPKLTGRSPSELESQYQLPANLFRIQVGPGSPLLNKKLLELNLSAVYELTIIEIRRRNSARNQILKTINQEVAGPDSIIQEADILYVHGTRQKAVAFADAYGLKLLDAPGSEQDTPEQAELYTTSDMGLAEVMLSPKSRLIGRLVRESGFREKYRLNVLGIQRQDKYLLHNVKEEHMRLGDALLVQGAWEDIALLASTDSEVIVVGQPKEESRKLTMDKKAPIAAGILLLLIILLVTEWIPAVAAVMVAAVLTVALGCIRGMEEAYRSIHWQSIVLIAGMIPMSTAIEKSGAAEWLSAGLADSLGSYGPMALLAGIYLTTSVLTMFISNTACAVLLAPIALSAATRFGVSPYAFLFAVSIGASMCFASPFSTPPNALVMSAGRYRFSHYLKVGLPLQIIMGIVMVAVLPLLYPF